jgi:hypothetical protein
MLSALACLGRRTVTGMLCTSGQQFADWSAAYRLFEKERFDVEGLFAPARQAVLERLGPNDPVIAHIDDTRRAKRGRKVKGASWHRDPLGPHFRTNLIWAQRFLQTSLALPEQSGGPCRSRAIPVDLHHCRYEAKPRKTASAQVWEEWRTARKLNRIPCIAAQRLKKLRESLDADPGGEARVLVASVDGGYTNAAVLKTLPERTVLIGRIRKDARLYDLPTPAAAGRGRRRIYGEPLPTPEAIRQDPSHEWKPVRAWAAGKVHEFDVKIVDAVRWRAAGPLTLRLVIVRPLAYRLSKQSPVLYRDPAYLICSDPNMSLEQLLQAYLWRWEVEVNFRDEKTLLGMGQAQVRQDKAVALVPAFIAAAYSYLLLSVQATHGPQGTCSIPRPKWQRPVVGQRITTPQMIGLLRAELWGKALGIGTANFSDFMHRLSRKKKPEKIETMLTSAVLYA